MNGRSRPDFVMLGTTVEDGVLLIASDTLTSAEIEQRWDQIEVTTWGDNRRRHVPGLRWCELHAEMHDLHVIHAPNYAEAFRNLFADWTPPTPERKAIPEGARGLRP